MMVEMDAEDMAKMVADLRSLDARVSELLIANNIELERRRSAENLVTSMLAHSAGTETSKHQLFHVQCFVRLGKISVTCTSCGQSGMVPFTREEIAWDVLDVPNSTKPQPGS